MIYGIVAVVAVVTSGIEVRLSVPAEVAFGDPIRVEVEFVNNGPISVAVPKLSPGTLNMALVDPTSEGVLIEPPRVGMIGDPITVTIAPGKSSVERADLWGFVASPVWKNARGRLATLGLLYPGRYQVVARARLPSQSQALVAKADFRITSTGRARELDLVRAALGASERANAAVSHEQWASLVTQLRACCSTSPLIEPVLKASCLAAAQPSEVTKCAVEFRTAFAASRWRAQVDAHQYNQLKFSDEFQHGEQVRKLLKGPEFKRHAEVLNSSNVALQVERTVAFVRDFPKSPAAADLLAAAIEALRAEGRDAEADALSRRLIKEYRESFRVRNWRGAVPLPAP